MQHRIGILDLAILFTLIAVGCLRIAATYGTLNQTYDEGAHLACGMEYLSTGQYTLEMLHPPLARVLIAAGPYVHGVRSHGIPDMWEEGIADLFDGNDYWRVLTLARMGTLLFYALGCVVVYLWGRRWFGRATGLVAAGLFSMLPPVLGHSGLATLDTGCCATIAMAAYCLMAWAEQPTRMRTLLLAFAIAMAVLTKYSAFVYLPACAVMMSAAWVVTHRPDLGEIRKRAAFYVPRLAGILAFTLILIWGGFRFSIKPLAAGSQYYKIGSAIPAMNRVASIPVPLSELALGLAQLSHHNGRGIDTYLLGQYSRRGWWYFFPVVLAVKTPLGMLVLLGVGLWLARKWIHDPTATPRLATLFSAVGILMVAMSSGINLGGRHIMPIYPFLALGAGYAIVWMCSGDRPRWMTAVAVLLLTFDYIETTRIGINQIAYFNPLAGARPEKVLAESDLDWGQDLHRVAVRARQLGIAKLSIAYFGTMPLERVGLPEFVPIDGSKPVTGWVAVSVRNQTLNATRDGTFAWLRGVEPRERVGRTIDLFYLPER